MLCGKPVLNFEKKGNWRVQITAKFLHNLLIYSKILRLIELQTTENKVCVCILIVSNQKGNHFAEKFIQNVKRCSKHEKIF